MTRNQLTKLQYKLNDRLEATHRIGSKMTLIFKSGFTLEYNKGEEDRIEWLVDKIANRVLN